MKQHLNAKNIRYIAASIVNTVFGYFAVIFWHYLLAPRFNMLTIGLAASICGITFSFFTLRLAVFKSQGVWWKEYLRCYIVYGAVTVLNIFGLWLLVDILGLSVWLAPFIITPICFVASYVSHTKFTFANGQHGKHIDRSPSV